MAKIPEIKRIKVEDFKEEDRDTVAKLANVLNTALEQIQSALTNNLTFSENFRGQMKDIEVTVDSSGVPTVDTSFKSSLSSSCKGLWVIKAENLTSSGTYPTAAPYVSFTESSGQIYVEKITGLQSANKYRLRIIALS
jgi:hypothetical protein